MSAAAAAAGEGGKEKGAAGPGPGCACELCGATARVYCSADEATLCWGCDAQVHGANFLVARHARALLCRGCARPTPWRAAGPRLGPTASLCDRCVRRGQGAVGVGGADEEMGGAAGGRDDEDDDNGSGDGDDEVVLEDEDDDDEEEEEGEGENQVVPWTEEAEATPPPVASSTSSSSREAPANGASAAECAKENVPCSTSQPGLCQYSSSARHGGRSDEATSSRNGGRFLASRHRKRSPSDFFSSGSAQSGSGTPARNCSNAGIGRNDFT
ncbi:zinc finger protein HD1-like [Miscanthus floridulus]|uniref:zinc finger protein HD1-like n=1 Tax=Miscanthus floridulus TaxID=154761 RepID=UPI003459B658